MTIATATVSYQVRASGSSGTVARIEWDGVFVKNVSRSNTTWVSDSFTVTVEDFSLVHTLGFSYASGTDQAWLRRVKVAISGVADNYGEYPLGFPYSNPSPSFDEYAIVDGSGAPTQWDNQTNNDHTSAPGLVSFNLIEPGAHSYLLKFDLRPDKNSGGADTTTIALYMDVDGIETYLGQRTSPPASVPDGTFEWGARSVDVSAVFDPAATDLYVRWHWVGTAFSDTAHVRQMRIEDGSASVIAHDQYRGHNSGKIDGDGETASDGGGPPGQFYPPCMVDDTTDAYFVADHYGDGYARHIFIPQTVCGGLVVGFMTLTP